MQDVANQIFRFLQIEGDSKYWIPRMGITQFKRKGKKYSPDCWILNYSNPAAVVAEATRRKFNKSFRWLY